MRCPKCGCAVAVKNGKVRDKQRYKCKACGCNHTCSSLLRTPLELRREAIQWYLEGAGFRSIARRLGVSPASVMRWVKRLGDDIERLRPQEGEQVNIMELDEMWHFVQKNTKMLGLACL